MRILSHRPALLLSRLLCAPECTDHLRWRNNRELMMTGNETLALSALEHGGLPFRSIASFTRQLSYYGSVSSQNRHDSDALASPG